MSAFGVIRERWRALAVVAACELVLSWLVGVSVVRYWIAPIRHLPGGASALFQHGGRALFDHITQNSARGIIAVLALAVIVCVYTVFSIWFAAFIPAVFAAENRESLTRSWRRTIHTTPSLLALAGFSLLTYALCGGLAFGFLKLAKIITHSIVNERTADLVRLTLVAIPALLLFKLQIWVDLARAHLMGCDEGIAKASRYAISELFATPLVLVARALIALTLSGLMFAIGFRSSGSVVATLSATTVVLVFAQQITSITRIVVRAWWTAHLTSPFRAPKPQDFSQIPEQGIHA